jgi:predicted Zn-dependent protease
VRGLLLGANQPEQAAAELHRAIHSLPLGFSRNNLELARALLDLGRAEEAIRVLQPAFRGWLEVGSFYTTRTELHARRDSIQARLAAVISRAR